MTVILNLNMYNKTALIHCLIIENPHNLAPEECRTKTGSSDYQKKASTLQQADIMYMFNSASKTDCCGTSWPLPSTPSTSAMKTQENMEEDSTDSEPEDERDIQMEHSSDQSYSQSMGATTKNYLLRM